LPLYLIKRNGGNIIITYAWPNAFLISGLYCTSRYIDTQQRLHLEFGTACN